MKLTPTQQKVYDRIIEVNNKNTREHLTSADLKSQEFGYNEIRVTTMKALVRAGLISVRRIIKMEHTTKTYNFGRETVPSTHFDKYFVISVDNNKTYERWLSNPWLESDHIRTEKYCNDTYWVFS